MSSGVQNGKGGPLGGQMLLIVPPGDGGTKLGMVHS